MAKSEKMTDDQLLELLERSPQEGMEALIEQYSPLVWRAAERRLGDPEDARECVNDVFLAFYRGRDRFDPDRGTLATYLAAIARNMAVSRYRENAAHERPTSLSDAAGPEDPMAAAEDRMDVERALERLTPEDAEIIRRKYYGGMTVAEIAAAMDLPYETVKKRHQRSLKRLRALLTAGLILLLAALLAACAYLVLRHFGIVPGLGVTGGAEIPAYALAEPVVLETEDGTCTVTEAVYVEGTLYIELRLGLHEEAEEQLKKALKAPDEPDQEPILYNGTDPHWMTIVCGGEAIDTVVFYDQIEDWNRVGTAISAPPPEDGMVRISFLGEELTVPMERREAGAPEGYPYAMGEHGGLLAIPRREEGRVTVELYALNTGEFPMSSMLVLDAYMQGDSTVITLTGEGGQVLHSNYRYDPAYHVTDTMSLWDFGEVEPGEYTLRVPYVYLVTDTIFAGSANIPLDLTTCAFSPERVQLPYGSVAIRSCEAVSGDRVPDWARYTDGFEPYEAGWLVTLAWEPPEGGDLRPLNLPLSVDLGTGMDHPHICWPEHPPEDGTMTFFCAADGEWTTADLAGASVDINGQMSLRWDHVFEIPLTIE